MALNRNGAPQGSVSKRTVTAKGDIIAATANAVVDRLPVGSDGQTLVANSAATTGLQWQTPVQQNPVLNSAFQVWQRGTSISLAASAATTYTADRWSTLTGANQASTISRQSTSDTTNLPNIQYCMRYQRNSGQTGTAQYVLTNSFESINSIPLAGKTIVLSYYARAGTNYSATSNALTAALITGTGTDQNRTTTSYTGENSSINSIATLTTTWQRFTVTGTVPTTATEMAVYFAWTPTGTASTNDYFEVTGVQLEVGSVATPFHTFSTTIQGELAACQRYYVRSVGQVNGGALGPVGLAISTTQAQVTWECPVSMRTTPSFAVGAVVGNVAVLNVLGSRGALTATANNGSNSNFLQLLVTVASGLASGSGTYMVDFNSGAGYLEVSAEL